MKIELIVVGKTDSGYLEEGIKIYLNRLKHYVGFEIKVVPYLKNTKSLSVEQQKTAEGELIMKQIKNTDLVVLLDENGKNFSSVEFSQFIEKQQNSSVSNLVFVIGGAYGFSEVVYARANSKISLSKMTFSHQMVRLVFTEQLYRAYTIMKGEPYHHI